jgi:glutamate synthase (NADPH/NADH) small chain
VPYCQVHCPLHNHIPDWLRLTAEGRLEEAYELSNATSFLPEICGRICPQDRLCEGNCVIEQAGHGTVTIGAVERYISDTAFEMGWVRPIRPLRELDLSVAVIGAGPAGLSAAAELRSAATRSTSTTATTAPAACSSTASRASSSRRRWSSAAPGCWPTAAPASS